jgi:hypothetical protein
VDSRKTLLEVAQTEEFFRAELVAIDITEADPFTGDRTATRTNEKTNEYGYQ